MEEYRKIEWRNHGLEYHEKVQQFITEEHLSNLYIYKRLDEPKREEKTDEEIFKKPPEPYVPGRKLCVNPSGHSLLTKQEQVQCLAALKCLQSGKEPGKFTQTEQKNIDLYKRLQTKIGQEQQKYLGAAKAVWLKKCSHLTSLKPSAYKRVKERWKKQLCRFMDYKHFYKDLKMVSLCYGDEDSPIDMAMLENLLEVGTIAKCTRPSLLSTFTLKLTTFPEDQEPCVSSKMPVSQDKNIQQLLLKHPADVVISSGGLHRILDNTDVASTWDIPVIVKEIEIKEGAIKLKKKVVFVDKPLPLTHPTKVNFSKICHKLLLRSNLCGFEAFTFSGLDLPPEKASSNENGNKEQTCDTANNSQGKKLYHNAFYRLWRLSNKLPDQSVLMKSNTDVKTVTLLVRTKLDGCESSENGQLQPVIISPKLEYQLEFGGSVATKSELSREWTSLFFRPFSKLYRVRINASNYQLVMQENCSMQKVNTEAMVNYQYKPHLSLGVLHRICVELKDLEPGNYLLHHTPKYGAFASICKEISEGGENCYNLRKKYEKCSPYLEAPIPWSPIDVNLIMPMHEAYGRVPCMFQGRDVLMGKGKKKRKQKFN